MSSFGEDLYDFCEYIGVEQADMDEMILTQNGDFERVMHILQVNFGDLAWEDIRKQWV